MYKDYIVFLAIFTVQLVPVGFSPALVLSGFALDCVSVYETKVFNKILREGKRKCSL